MGSPRASLEELHAKYAQMLAMRLAHASGEEDPEEVRVDMARLAARFPGALRELDELELDEIRHRIEALERVLHHGHEAEPWMEAVALLHQLWRGALSAKRWLDGRKDVDQEVERAFVQALPLLAFRDDAEAWLDDLAALAAPPRGRLSEVVLARLARLLETTDVKVRQLVFGSCRTEASRL